MRPWLLNVCLVLVLLCLLQSCASGAIASWYGAEHAGKPTASGETFDPSALTAASYRFPLGTRLRVSAGGHSVIVRVNDRGPAKRLGRDIDLSRAAFEQLADPAVGLLNVTITRLP